jgi:predicted HTH transcriptional regulator
MIHESKNIEYKEKLTDNLEKEVVAFLNCTGGAIYIGIDKNGNKIGISEVDKLQLTIKDRLKNNITPSIMGLFDIVVEKHQNIHLIKIVVAGEQEKPYYIKKYGLSEKGTFIRIGSACEPMPTDMIEKLFAKRTRNSIGKIRSPQQDLRFEQLRIYYDSQHKTLNEQFAKNLELIDEDGNYNLVAYLIADANTISVKTAKYSGLDRVDLIENNEHGFCSIIKATKLILDKIEIENKTLTRITSRERQDRKLWNAVALREAVINAMVHNDYTKELAPKIEFFQDRIEITSYGGLPEGLSKKRFFLRRFDSPQ